MLTAYISKFRPVNRNLRPKNSVFGCKYKFFNYLNLYMTHDSVVYGEAVIHFKPVTIKKIYMINEM
jgi:hypothetical protein